MLKKFHLQNQLLVADVKQRMVVTYQSFPHRAGRVVIDGWLSGRWHLIACCCRYHRTQRLAPTCVLTERYCQCDLYCILCFCISIHPLFCIAIRVDNCIVNIYVCSSFNSKHRNMFCMVMNECHVMTAAELLLCSFDSMVRTTLWFQPC